jgi:hypothetical protein
MSEEQNAGAKKPFQVVDRRRFDSEGRERRQETEEVSTDSGSESGTDSGHRASQASGIAAQHVRSEESVFASGAAAAQGEPLQGDQAIAQQFRMESAEGDEADVSFMSFLMSLATQALVQIGEMEPPEGMDIPVDVEAGRQTIEILSMLQRKTRGNLSNDEARFLEEVLHSLRMSYVRRAR